MWKSLAINILRYRVYYLLAMGIWVILLGIVLFTQDLKFSRNSAQLLPSDSPITLNQKEFSKLFGSDESIIFIGVNDSLLTSHNKFKNWILLTKKLKNLKGVKKIYSVGEALLIEKDTIQKNFFTTPINNNISNFREYEKAVEIIKNQPFYNDFLYNPKTHALQTLLYLDKDIINSEEREKVVVEINNAVEEFKTETKIPAYLSGMPVIRTFNAKEVKKESFVFILAALGITCLIFFLIFRSVKATLTAITVVVITVFSSFATMAVLDYEITLLTALVPPLLIVIGIPNCIFLLNKYFQEYQDHQNKAKALVRMIMKIGNATFMTNFTTAFGFFTFIFTDSDTLREFGIVASFNIMLIFIISIILIPIAYSYYKSPKQQKLKHLNYPFITKIIEGFSAIIITHRKWVFGISFIIVLLSFIGIFRIERSANLLDDMSKNTQFYKDISFFDENFGGVLPLEIVVQGRPKMASKLSTLERVNTLQYYVDSLPITGKPLSIVNAIKFSKQAFYNGNPEFYDLPSNYEKNYIYSYLQNTKSEENFLKNYVDTTESSLRITTLLKNVNSQQLESAIQQIEHKTTSIFPKAQFNTYITGVAYVFMKGTEFLTKNLLLSLTIAILLISLFMAYIFRSFKMILISLIPNFIPLLVTAGVMGFFNIPIKPSTILVFSMAFGIAVDDTIHFLVKYRQELVVHRKIKKSIIKAIEGAGPSMFYSSLVLFLGFGVFMFSSFQGIQALGGLVAITLLAAMFTNLIVLPSLLLEFKTSTDQDFRLPGQKVYKDQNQPLDEAELKSLHIEEEG